MFSQPQPSPLLTAAAVHTGRSPVDCADLVEELAATTHERPFSNPHPSPSGSDWVLEHCGRSCAEAVSAEPSKAPPIKSGKHIANPGTLVRYFRIICWSYSSLLKLIQRLITEDFCQQQMSCRTHTPQDLVCPQTPRLKLAQKYKIRSTTVRLNDSNAGLQNDLTPKSLH